jgi:thioredoxin-related protein
MVVCTMKGHSQADTTKGIAFEQGLSWQEVLQKAKNENKYVFVDCYATWCGPCKSMDKMVYPNDSVGAYMNDRFISVRIQMDTTQQDNEEVRGWYTAAHAIEEKYWVGTYPCYLFFSPDGRAVHKKMGRMDIKNFLSMARAAMDSNQQYYTLLANYRKGERNYVLMPFLTQAAENVHNFTVAMQVAADYLHHYLDKLPEEKIWTEETIKFVNQYLSDTISYGDKLFRSYYKHRDIIDSIMKSSTYVDYMINKILYRDEIKPEIDKAVKTGSEPNWRRLEKSVAKSCNEYYAHKNALQGQIDYYKSRKNWKSYVKYFIRQKEEEGIENWKPGGWFNSNLNDAAWEVFQYGNRRELIEKALPWVDRVLSNTPSTAPYPEAIDTRANILYKLGRRGDGLALEEQAHILAPKYTNNLSNANIQANYEKMKNGLATWVYK